MIMEVESATGKESFKRSPSQLEALIKSNPTNLTVQEAISRSSTPEVSVVINQSPSHLKGTQSSVQKLNQIKLCDHQKRTEVL